MQQLEWCGFKFGRIWDLRMDPCQVMSTSVISVDDVIDISLGPNENKTKSDTKGNDLVRKHPPKVMSGKLES